MSELKQWSVGESQKEVIKTKGYWVEYRNGEKHIDIQCGNAAYVLGYGDEDIMDAMRSCEVNFLRGNSGESSSANDELIKFICETGNWASVAWAVSGSDAVEAAIAMNDTYWMYRKYPNKSKIVSFVPGYHGTTMLAKHLRGEYPSLNRSILINAPSWKNITDQQTQEQISLSNLRKVLEEHNESIGCVIMETIPWMGDISPYSKTWWETVRKLCDEFNVLMIVDDVAVCWGKNGTFFGWQPYGVQPDITSLGKSLTAGYSPLGAAACNKKVHTVISSKSWEHGHTWAPNTQGVAASLAATKKISILIDRVPEIHTSLRSIAEEFDLNWRGENLFMCYDTPRNITLAELSAVGMAATIPGDNCIKVIAPLIADETYFQTLRERMQKVLSS